MQVQDCTGTSGVAEPDPCVLSRELLADGDVKFTVLTSHASAWNFGVDDIPPAAPAISNPTNNSYDADGTITLSGTAEGGTTVEIYEGTTKNKSTQADSGGTWSVTLSAVSSGKHTYKATATDAANNTSGFSNTLTVTVDTSKPAGAVTINRGATSTNSRTVTLKLSATDPSPASGVSLMRFRNENTSKWSPWMTYATSKSWTLSPGTGTKTVYVQYKDRAGNMSAAARDSIVYRP